MPHRRRLIQTHAGTSYSVGGSSSVEGSKSPTNKGRYSQLITRHTAAVPYSGSVVLAEIKQLISLQGPLSLKYQDNGLTLSVGR